MQPTSLPRRCGFTLVEVLVVIAIIGIMTSLVITVYRNVAEDSRDVVARQQQAALQNALNNWITSETTTRSVAQVRADYIAISTDLGRLNQLGPYLDEGTLDHFNNATTEADKIVSSALLKLGKHIQFSSWDANSYPQVQMTNSPSHNL